LNVSVDPRVSFRAEIQRLRGRGYQVVRLRPGTKMAFEKGWPDLKREASDFKPGDNVGVKFGPASGGLVDIDLDYPTARALAGCPVFGLNHLAEFGRSSQPAGKRGHRLVTVPDGPDQSRVFGIRSKEASALLKERGLGLTIVEIRGSHGSQTAVPPSVVRQADNKPDPLVWTDRGANIPAMPWAVLNRRVGRLAFAALAASIYPADNRLEFCIAVYGALLEAGVASDDAATMVGDIARLSGDEEIHDVAIWRVTEGLADFLEMACLQMLDGTLRSWLGLPPSDNETAGKGSGRPELDHLQNSEESGVIDADGVQRLLDVLDPCDFPGYHDHLSILQAAHHATGGSRAARETFVTWSARNPDYGAGKRDPHGKLWGDVIRGIWDRSKVERDGDAPVNTIATILYHVREAGFGHVANEVRHQITFERDRQMLVEELLDPQWLEGGEQSARSAADEQARPHPYRRYSIEDLLGLPDPVWTVEGMLLERSLAMLYGAPKSYKTFLAFDLALCIATGRPFHGVPVVRGRVTYTAAEGHAAETRDRVLAWCRENSVKHSELAGWFDLVISGVRLDKPDSVKEFIKADPSPRAVTFFDTLNRNMEGHESDTKDMTAVVAGCDKVRRDLKTAVIVVHHTGVDASRERGSTVLRGAADTRLKVTRKAGSAITLLVEDQRAGPDGAVMYFRPAVVPVSDFDGPDSVVMRLTEAPSSNGYQDQGPPKVSADEIMLMRIYERKPAQYSDLVDEEVKGLSKANVYKVRDRLVTGKFLRPGDRPTLTREGAERAQRLLEEEE
jgi:hypothetical protein